ncbi:MAG: carboxymuconolactone decarboxylase family protein [Deltaproteobacteria bacterium]|nr:carboxymuconolactone decarboxylase family protein [Deltaproteobacteria bacterium]
MKENEALINKEKALVALSAAMGAGCRTCAKGLHPMAQEAGATNDEIERSLRVGVEMRQYATTTVRREVDALLGRQLLEESVPCTPTELRLEELCRVAAAVGANSSPDARRHIEAAIAAGSTEAGIELAMALARKVRSKAASFSDSEIGEFRHEKAEHREAGEDRGEGAAEGRP